MCSVGEGNGHAGRWFHHSTVSGVVDGCTGHSGNTEQKLPVRARGHAKFPEGRVSYLGKGREQVETECAVWTHEMVCVRGTAWLGTAGTECRR